MSEPTESEIVNQETPVALTKHPERTVQFLEAAFNNGFNITEACAYAEISRETYYNWLEDDDIFSFRMSKAQAATTMKAKQVVVDAIQQGDIQTARWYLDRRDPDFKAKGELEISPGQQRTEQKLKEFMDDTDDGAYPAIATGADAISAEPAAPSEPTGGNEVASSPSDIS